MALISVDIDGVREANQELIKGLPDLMVARDYISSMNKSLSQGGRNRRGIQEQINSICSKIDTLIDGTRKIIESTKLILE